MSKKVVMIGLDSATADFTRRFADEGILPNLKKLMDNGVLGEAICPFPSLTGSNWHTIVTGAWPGTHGCTDMWVHMEGELLDKLRCAFLTTYCRAEYLWSVAERHGKKPLLMKYAASLPMMIREGIQVEGCATPWWGGGGANFYEISPCELYTTMDLPDAIRIKLVKAEGWTNVPESRLEPLEGIIEVKPQRGEGSIRYFILVIATTNKGYDKLLMCRSKNASDIVATLRQGEWSPWLKEKFMAIQGPPSYAIQKIGRGRERRLVPYYENGAAKKLIGTFRFKLIELSWDGRRIRLYRSQVFPATKFSKPEFIAEELVNKIGPFQEHIGPYALYHGWIDEETFLEELEYQADWLGKASKHLMKKYDWDLFLLQWHGCNHAQHVFWSNIDPISPWHRPRLAEKGWKAFKRFYGAADKMVGEIIEGAGKESGKESGKDAVIFIISDHGHVPLAYGTIYIANILVKEGLITIEHDKKGKAVHFRVIDRKRTKLPLQ